VKFLIDILLSTYNGQKYLPSLLESLENQSNTLWDLIVRDDGSSDESNGIVRAFQAKHPDNVAIVDNAQLHLGPKDSFAELLKHSNAPYCMFCDQDDVWLPAKIELTYNKMRETEADGSVPVLVYTDLIVANANLDIIDESFFHFQNIATHLDHDKYYLFYKNPSAGCTIMINHAAVEAIQPIGSKAVMHDWWTSIFCSTSGIMACLNTPTALYRQHQFGTLGAEMLQPFSLRRYLGTVLLSTGHFKKTIRRHCKFISQAKEASMQFGFQFSATRYFWSIFCGRLFYPILASAGLIDNKKIWKHL
jgi:glycosyltransferase involved in cell wall biosynthesis